MYRGESMTTNDNTLKTLGLIYQTYIALIKCFEMKENDRVVIENLGDVTLISSKGISQQLEVKHHLDATSISERSDEIWNTVWNWYNNFDKYKDIEEFILYTTADISISSVFQKWSTQDIDQKYNRFKNIGIEIRDNEKAFRSSYNKIFSSEHDIDKLKSVLNRFKVLSKQQTIKTVISQYESTTLKFLAEKDKMEIFVSSLVGILLTIPIKNKSWEISYDEFDKIFKDLAKRYTDGASIPLPTEFEEYQLSIVEKEKLKSKKFVDEINRINLSDEVIEAINDYCRTYKTIIAHFDSSIVKTADLEDYKKDLTKTLSFKRKSYKLKCASDKNLILPKSQEMYFDSMAMDATDFKGICHNRSFFQRGVMHIIIDDGNLTWYVGDKT